MHSIRYQQRLITVLHLMTTEKRLRLIRRINISSQRSLLLTETCWRKTVRLRAVRMSKILIRQPAASVVLQQRLIIQ